MIQEIRKELIQLFTQGRALQWRLPPTMAIEASLREQARFLGYQVVHHHWDNHESRMMFRNIPQSLLAYNSSSAKPTLFIIEGFWRWKIYSKQAHVLIESLAPNDRILFVEDSLDAPQIANAKQGSLLISKIEDYFTAEQLKGHTQIKPEDWIESLVKAPFEFDLYEEMDNLTERGPNAIAQKTFDTRTQLFEFLTKVLPFRNYGDDLLSMELLVELLRTHLGITLQYETLTDQLGVSGDTIKRWINSLIDSGLIIPVNPYSVGVPRALKTDKKFYFYDWGLVPHGHSRLENFIASSLWCYLKNQRAGYELRHLKTKEDITIDFVITRDEKPLVAIDLIRPNQTEISKSKKTILQTLDCPHIQVTQDPLTWARNEKGSLISLPYLILGI